MNPPARNAMWRFGFPNPVNYNDNELFCGGYAGQFDFSIMTSIPRLIVYDIYVFQSNGNKILAIVEFAVMLITFGVLDHMKLAVLMQRE